VSDKTLKSRNTNIKSKKKPLKKKKLRIKYKNLLLILLALILACIGVYLLTLISVKTIIIKGNNFYTDQEIIDMAGLRNYPGTLSNSSLKIEKKLNKDTYIKNVNVSKKKLLTKVIITVEENIPVFYYQPAGKTVLADGSLVEDKYSLPIVINQIPDSIYEKFLKKMTKVPNDVLIKMSEIKYTPNDVDAELFLITMNDGNYVYVNIYKFERVYKYIEYLEGFNNKKGILHLDSGDYLEIKEEN
jgi:cell division protein FtsQ